VVCTTKKMFFKRFWRWSSQKSRFFTPIYGFVTIPSYKYHPNSPPFLTQTSPTLSSSSFYNHVFPSLAFHRKRSLWKFSEIVWTVNEDGTALQKSAVHLGVMLVSLGLRLVCLGARLTIMVSCSLEAHVPSPVLFSSSPSSSFLPPFFLRNSFRFLCNKIRNSFRFLCNKLKKIQHYCNMLFIYQ